MGIPALAPHIPSYAGRTAIPERDRREAIAWWEQYAPKDFKDLLIDLLLLRALQLLLLRRVILLTLSSAERDMLLITQRFTDGEIVLDEWKRQMRGQIIALNRASAALALGSWVQAVAIQRRIEQQLKYFDRFVMQLRFGTQPLDGRVPMRVRMYAQAGRGTFEEGSRERMKVQGYTQERRIRHAHDSCVDCIEYEAAGWQPIGTLPTIGDSLCRSNCLCVFQFRQAT